MPKRALVSIGIDVDAVCGWISTYGGADSPNDISRGVFAGEVGVPRLLKMLKKYDIKASWFVPTHSLKTFPKQIAAVRDAGHELGLHGWCHESPQDMSVEQQRDVLDASMKELEEFCGGTKPVGHVTCWWQTSKESNGLLRERGIQYDHSSQAHDCQPFYDVEEYRWTKVDYSQKAETWMKPLERGPLTDLVQIPANWLLDDLPPHMFMPNKGHTHGFVDADVTLKLWKSHFDYFYREEDWFVFPLTIHPDVSGRPNVLMIVEKLIEYCQGFEGFEFVTMKQVNDEFRQRHPFSAAVQEQEQ
ncbi:hypothetical protein JCM6882_007207 [Rhodosporidiobolus microsporus]